MVHSTEEFRVIVKSARRVGTPLAETTTSPARPAGPLGVRRLDIRRICDIRPASRFLCDDLSVFPNVNRSAVHFRNLPDALRHAAHGPCNGIEEAFIFGGYFLLHGP